jgi:hypothetical protein
MPYTFTDYLKETAKQALLNALNRTPSMPGFHKGIKHIGTFYSNGYDYAFNVDVNGKGTIRCTNIQPKQHIEVACLIENRTFVDVSYPN